MVILRAFSISLVILIETFIISFNSSCRIRVQVISDTTKTKLFSEVISYQYMFNMYGIF